jgi:hypothetical protein
MSATACRLAGIGIVNGVDVARMNVAGESAHDVLAGEVQRADMNSDVLIALGGGITLRVMKPDRRSHPRRRSDG